MTAIPQTYPLIEHHLNAYKDELQKYTSTKSLLKSALFKSLKDQILLVVNGMEADQFSLRVPYERKKFYRFVTWNIERGINFNDVVHVFKTHPDLSRADVIYLVETDIGMARTRNVNIARELARELKMNYFFATSYLNLCKGNLAEGHYEGENELGLHGNAILSRYPLHNLRTQPLKNAIDKMRGKEKRLGCQKALVCEIEFPFRKVTGVAAHLDAHSSQRQRAAQLKSILSFLAEGRHPLVLGGDLNTSSYNARHALFAFFGFWNKVFRGVDHVIANHYPYPDRYFDRFLFKVFKDYGFDYEHFNEIGQGTLHYSIEDIKQNHLVREVVPEWCRRVMEETLKRHGGKCSLKLDWFAGKWVKPAHSDLGALSPKVYHNLVCKNGTPISDHDPILVDIDIYS
ncbi:MAG: hypothetical protein A3G32_00650 [Deltaproteobacteria bacterium RIFCSPLOWO2_12_FULL_40_28]|nr:MAG: hypothetical protein A3C45_10385 [Deltaproteobacteria bacterium RIFCSPHIGHO2_02_FULL_40_28]OGQ20198.1 MAG: hypothetical protein A3E27_01170 [Deltaproteobacteria bacterium RIFCSPHIGHO2_12_FULL_40_32]OGQ40189.1 MAG: hypothetical protein A3I69_09120 [Deltaproteobacteria bacterium RIFCSPLOWO2_02_FULL_40_36]OGQ54753.1 MAG: hypothetical protein A3G32_00650 [Deltaproteobacteria bacterium RIFCSPLOWO2_12_FULL_40_28]